MGVIKKTSPIRVRHLRDKDLVVNYYLGGRTMLQVCDKMKEDYNKTISISRVSQIIAAATEEWKKEQSKSIEEKKMVEIEKINNLEKIYTDAWQRSLLAAETTISKMEPGRTPAAKKKLKEVIKTIRESAGDPRYLQGIQWCIEKRCELMGHDAPQKIEANLTGTITNNTTVRKVLFTGRGKAYESIPETHVDNNKDQDQ